jgi:hypothetical protein
LGAYFESEHLADRPSVKLSSALKKASVQKEAFFENDVQR